MKANIKHLLRALAALYISIYYKGEKFDLDSHCHLKLHDVIMGSSIFAVNTAICNPLDETALSAIYVIKPSDKGFKRY